MTDFLKKHWLYLLGALFIGMGFAYLLKYAIEINVLNNYLKISICLFFSMMTIISGIILLKKVPYPFPDLTVSLGTIMLYASLILGLSYFKTFGYTLFILAATTTLICTIIFSSKLHFRILSSVSFVSFGLTTLSVFSIPSSPVQIPLISLILVVCSIMLFRISHIKNWFELKLITFIGSWFIFYSLTPKEVYGSAISQFIFSYTLLFLAFTIVLMISMASTSKIKITEYVMFIYNAFLFLKPVSNLIQYIPIKIIFLVSVGLIYIICAILINYIWGQTSRKYFLISLVLGAYLVLDSITLINFSKEFAGLVSTYIWIFITVMLLLLRKTMFPSILKIFILILWFITSIFWFLTSSHIPVTNWFGKFIPILNPAAIAWIFLALLGFLISSRMSFSLFGDSLETHKLSKFTSSAFLPSLIKIISNLLLIKMVSVEINNVWTSYNIAFANNSILFTLFLGIYSITLLLYSLYGRNLVFRNFSLVILIIATFKCLFLDLKSASNIYKVIILISLGIITIIIASLNKKLIIQNADEHC